MVTVEAFNPNEHPSQCDEYLNRFPKDRVRFVHADPLTKSTRDAPWRLAVEVDGAARFYVLRLGSNRSEHEYEVLRAMESIPIPTPRVYGWDPEGKPFVHHTADSLGATLKRWLDTETLDDESRRQHDP